MTMRRGCFQMATVTPSARNITLSLTTIGGGSKSEHQSLIYEPNQWELMAAIPGRGDCLIRNLAKRMEDCVSTRWFTGWRWPIFRALMTAMIGLRTPARMPWLRCKNSWEVINRKWQRSYPSRKFWKSASIWILIAGSMSRDCANSVVSTPRDSLLQTMRRLFFRIDLPPLSTIGSPTSQWFPQNGNPLKMRISVTQECFRVAEAGLRSIADLERSQNHGFTQLIITTLFMWVNQPWLSLIRPTMPWSNVVWNENSKIETFSHFAYIFDLIYFSSFLIEFTLSCIGWSFE